MENVLLNELLQAVQTYLLVLDVVFTAESDEQVRRLNDLLQASEDDLRATAVLVVEATGSIPTRWVN